MNGREGTSADPRAPWTAPQRGVMVLAVAQVLSLVMLVSLAGALPTSFLRGHAAFFIWSAAVGSSFLMYLRGRGAAAATVSEGSPVRRYFFTSLPALILLAGAATVAAVLIGGRWGAGTALPAGSPERIRLAAMLSGVAAFALFFAGRWTDSVQRQGGGDLLRSAIHLNWMGIAVHLLGAAALFLYLYSGIDGLVWTGRAVMLATLALMADAATGLLADIYRPPAERGRSAFGRSALLDWTLSRANPVDRVAEAIEKTYGVKLKDIWAFRFLGSMAAPLAALGALLAWTSTCLTVIPADSEGVRVRLGRFHPESLKPGLHAGWPWPFEQIVIVPTRRTEEIHLGYDEDLGGPILWSERHYRGEKNMLAGNGDELLTVSILIYFRIADPVAHLLHARGHREVLTHVAYQQLVHTLAARESFRVMIVEREEISARMRESLQAAADSIGLGVQVLYVGLRDIHPPVDVAPAYQEVVSAEEKRHASVYGGQKYRSINLPAAHQAANKIRIEAEARGTARVTKATGEAGKFSTVETAFRAAPAMLRERYLLETLETSLAGRPKLVIDSDARVNTPATLYLPLDPGYSMLPVLDDQPPKENK